MSVKEIKERAEFLYQKSSHYIVGAFLAVGTITAIVNGFSYYLPFLVLAVLIEPLQLGLIRASLKAYDRKGKEVSTLNYTLMGLKEYPSAFPVFVGKKLFILIVQMLIMAIFMVVSAGNMSNLVTCLKSFITGTTGYLFSQGTNGIEWYIPDMMVIGFAVAMIVGLYLQIKLALVYYFAVDKDYSLFKSIQASFKAMKGNTIKYLSLLLRYLFLYIATTIIVLIANTALTNGFTQLIDILPNMAVPIAILMTVLIALASTTFQVMIYEVKLRLAVTVFYKDITEN